MLEIRPGESMSTDSNPDFDSELRRIKQGLQDVRSVAIQKISERLSDPRLSENERVWLEERLKKLKDIDLS